MEVRKINASDISGFTIKRVCAYVRVSTNKDEAEHSLESQIDYFSRYISGYPGWVFAGIYADDGISGTKVNRPEFTRMMEDAKAGKIDIILAKSVTRFARNITALLNAARELRQLGIDVVFEKENIRTMSPDGELMLSLLATYAEEEARSASDNMHWQIQKQFERGRPTYFAIYGYEWMDGQLQVIPEEAKVIRRIFDLYLQGKGMIAIARTLNQAGIRPARGKAWTSATLSRILSNEKYTGDLLLQKSYTADFRTKKQIENKGQWRQFYVKDAHEPIIDRATFEEVQKQRAERSMTNQEMAPSRLNPKSLFAGLVICGKCKKHYVFKNQKVKSQGTTTPLYICKTYLESGKDHCDAKRIKESILIDKTKQVLSISPSTNLTRDLILEHISAIESAVDNRLRFFLNTGEVKIVPWENESRSKSWTEEKKAQARAKAYQILIEKKEVAHA